MTADRAIPAIRHARTADAARDASTSGIEDAVETPGGPGHTPRDEHSEASERPEYSGGDECPNASTNPEPDLLPLDDAGSLAAAIDERVSLHPASPAWAHAFEIERDHLRAVAADVFVQIEHIGSTAVPGLVAKPIIDILAGVASLEDVDALVDRLCENGYATSREFNATLADRRWLMRWRNGHRTHHLHIVEHGGKPWIERLAFRDALRQDRALAERYAALKTDLAARHPDDREAYTDAKADFVRTVVTGALGR